MPQMDMSGMDVLKDPVVKGFTYTQLLSGMALSLILLISGIGLIRLASWGRSMAVAWAALQIIQIVLLSAGSYFYVQPVTVAYNEKMVAKMEADAKAPNAAPGTAESIKMMKAMSGSATTNVFLVGFLVVGCIYPITVLVLLNNPGARGGIARSQAGRTRRLLIRDEDLAVPSDSNPLRRGSIHDPGSSRPWGSSMSSSRS